MSAHRDEDARLLGLGLLLLALSTIMAVRGVRNPGASSLFHLTNAAMVLGSGAAAGIVLIKGGWLV